MTTTIKAEATRILTIAGIDVENKVLSCNEGDPARTDDDTCRIDEIDWEKFMSGNAGEGHNPRDIRFDDLFSRANALNLARKTPRELDTHNYFFRLDSNAVFFRREQYDRSNLGEGGLLFRVKGSVEWRQLQLTDIQASPALTAAVVPVLLDILRASRADYDRLNGSPHHGDDFGYAQAKAVMWLNDLIPSGDASYRDALLQAFPSMNADGQFFAWYRFQSEGRGGELASALVALSEDSTKDAATRSMARSLLRDAVPSVSPEDWSSQRVVRPQVAWEMFGGVYLPLPLREGPASSSWSGEKEPVGSYVAAGIGLQLCIGPRIDCARRQGFRIGALGEVKRMTNGFGFVSLGGKLFAGNQLLVGFAEASANLYTTGGFLGEGNYGEVVTKPSIGGGLRLSSPWENLPLAISGGFRMDPTDYRNSGFSFGFGGAQ